MKIGSKEWQRIIIDGARKLGIVIDECHTALFSTHAAELINWNRKINLTAITNPREIAIKHFLDSLAPAGCIPDGARLLDIGSGAGFAGIPLKILKPSISVLLIDAVLKKINFLKYVLRILGLENIEARQIRTENLLNGTGQAASFDVVISRALAKQGTIIAMKGKVDAKELDAVRADAPGDQYSLEVERYKLPSIQAPRSLVIIKHLH
jgi:16S rRNA (guanine527-N7)-methyltransferase